MNLTKLSPKLSGLALGAALITAPVLLPSGAYAATGCGIGQTDGICVGAQDAGNGVWEPASVGLQAAGSTGTVSITSGGVLDIPYYDVVDGNTADFYSGPGLVKSWQIPANADANAFVLPSKNGVAGSALVAVHLPATMNESGIYSVAWPALEPGKQQLSGGSLQLTFAGQGANTIPVTYTANEPVFSLGQHGPWVKSLTVPPNTASWFNEPMHPAGLITRAVPHYLNGNPYANGTQYSGVPNGMGMFLLVPAAGKIPVSTVPPRPVTTSVKKNPQSVTALRLQAPTTVQVDQTVPVAITLTKNGKPFAYQRVRVSTSEGQLRHRMVTTNGQGLAKDRILHAAKGTIHITAKQGALTAAAMVVVASPFPWWILLVLLVAAALVVLVILRRRHHDGDDEHPTAS